MGEYAHWIEHFHRNGAANSRLDAIIAVDSRCRLSAAARGPLVASVQRFQLGESGDGAQLLREAAMAGDSECSCAAALFVVDENQHAALLLRLFDYLGAEPIEAHWSDTVFVRLRRRWACAPS